MQQQMDLLSPWPEKWRIKIKADECEAVIFKKFRRMPRARPPPVTLNGEEIEWKRQVKYLGVTLDTGLNFQKENGGEEETRFAAANSIKTVPSPSLCEDEHLLFNRPIAHIICKCSVVGAS
jgi:hypothetical protein